MKSVTCTIRRGVGRLMKKIREVHHIRKKTRKCLRFLHAVVPVDVLQNVGGRVPLYVGLRVRVLLHLGLLLNLAFT